MRAPILLSPIIYASVLVCIRAQTAAAVTATVNDAPSKILLDTRDPPGQTLVPDFKWVRSVQEPYYHFYLQTDPQLEPGPAILGDPTTAAQWAIQDGQLVELVDTDGTLLHMNVEQPMNSTTRMLGVSLAADENSFGAFAWSGDALTWSVSTIDRPNDAAWLVCQGDLVYINLGSYGYDTPEGCADATIHSYGAATTEEL